MGIKEQVRSISQGLSEPFNVLGEKRSYLDDMVLGGRMPYMIGSSRIERGLLIASSLPSPMKDWLTKGLSSDPIIQLYERGRGSDHFVRIILSSDERDFRQLFVIGSTVPFATGYLVADIFPELTYTPGCGIPRKLSKGLQISSPS